MNNIFDRLTFQRFVDDNFDKVIGILNNGVHYFDESLFVNLVRQSDHRNTVNNWKGYVGVIHGRSGKYKICVAEGRTEDLSPLAEKTHYSGEIINSTYYLFIDLKKDEGFNSDKSVSDVFRYTYTDLDGKEKKVYSKMVPCDKWVGFKKSEESFFSFDFDFNFGINSKSDDVKSKIWDAFYLLYSVMYNASKDEASKAAAIDFQDNVKVVCGMFANPFRFLLSQGDQYLKYIFDAFDIEKDVKKAKLAQIKDETNSKKDAEIKYSDRIQHLKGTVPAGFLRLMHFYKNVRNLEGHRQVVIDRPVSLMENYLLYNVALIYVLRYVLGYEPSENLAKASEELKENLYYPVTFNDNIGINIEGSCVVAMNTNHYFVPAFSVFTIMRGEEQNNVSISDLKTTGLIVTPDLKTHNSAVLDAINRIEYNPILDSIRKQLADLRKSSVSKGEMENMIREKLEGFFNELNETFVRQSDLESRYLTQERFDEEKKKILEEIPSFINNWADRVVSLEGTVVKQGHDINVLKLICFSFAALILLSLFVFGLANIRPWAIKNDGIYWLANKLWVFHDKGDLSYDRAKYIEGMITSNMVVNDSIINSHNYLRRKAFDAYSNARKWYEQQLQDSKNNPKAAYRLALMYSLAKGGAYDEKKAAEYASEAVRNKYADKSRSLKEILMFFSTGDEIYLSGACLDKVSEQDEFAPLLREMVALADMKTKPAVDSLKRESMKRIQSIALGQSDAKETACIVMADLLRGGIEAFGEIDREPLLEILMLQYTSIKHNSLLAQASLGDIYRTMGLIEQAAIMYMCAFYNGSDISGEQGLVMLIDRGIDIEEVYAEWPLTKEKFENSELIAKQLSDIMNLANENKMRMFDAEMKKIRSDMEKLDFPLVLKKGKYFEEFVFFNNPDSADAFLNNLHKMTVSDKVKFLSDVDSLEKRTAVENYVWAVYELEGFGSKRIGKAKADSLLRESAVSGFIPAI